MYLWNLVIIASYIIYWHEDGAGTWGPFQLKTMTVIVTDDLATAGSSSGMKKIIIPSKQLEVIAQSFTYCGVVYLFAVEGKE